MQLLNIYVCKQFKNLPSGVRGELELVSSEPKLLPSLSRLQKFSNLGSIIVSSTLAKRLTVKLFYVLILNNFKQR